MSPLGRLTDIDKTHETALIIYQFLLYRVSSIVSVTIYTMGGQQFPDIHVSVVDTDPHLRQRTVPMKVLVLGYPRTGTSCTNSSTAPSNSPADYPVAMQMALEQLGFGPCYHMRTAMNQYPRDCAMWLEAFRAKYDGIGVFEKQQWDQLLGKYSVRLFSLSLYIQTFEV